MAAFATERGTQKQLWFESNLYKFMISSLSLVYIYIFMPAGIPCRAHDSFPSLDKKSSIPGVTPILELFGLEHRKKPILAHSGLGTTNLEKSHCSFKLDKYR